ncbi:hypothetical protein TNCV_2515351, partial [Trichonephila clavipes]
MARGPTSQRHNCGLWLRSFFPLGCRFVELLQFSQPTGGQTRFESSLFSCLANYFGVQKCRTTGYHPQVYELLLKKFLCTPAELVFGTTIRLPGD